MIIAIVTMLLLAPAQDVPAAPAATVPGIVVKRDTPVELMAISEVSTDKARPGTIIKLRVNRAVDLGGGALIPVGTPAFGEVLSAQDSGGLGKAGRMTARLVRIQYGDATIPLEGELSAKGTGGGSAATAVLFTGVLGLFHRGNNAKIKAGEIVAAFVAEDVVLDLSGAAPRRVETAAARSQ